MAVSRTTIRDTLAAGLKAITGNYASMVPQWENVWEDISQEPSPPPRPGDFYRDPPSVPKGKSFSTDNLISYAVERYAIGWANPRAIFGSTSA
jgi:hypothetical protein